MGITRKVLNWTDNKMDEVYDNKNEKHPRIKTIVLGGVEGLIDAAVIAYPILIVGLFAAGKRIKKLKG